MKIRHFCVILKNFMQIVESWPFPSHNLMGKGVRLVGHDKSYGRIAKSDSSESQKYKMFLPDTTNIVFNIPYYHYFIFSQDFVPLHRINYLLDAIFYLFPHYFTHVMRRNTCWNHVHKMKQAGAHSCCRIHTHLFYFLIKSFNSS